jgi:hypothetical protein
MELRLMIDRTYRCDLCRMVFCPNVDAAYGIYWGGHPERIIEKPVREVEHHLCLKCIQRVVALFQTIRLPESPATVEAKP